MVRPSPPTLGFDIQGEPQMLQFRPGPEAEQQVRSLIRKQYPLATSAYTIDGAEVYDPVSGEVLGRANTGDWAVERAWQSAAEAREPFNAAI